MSSSSRTLTFKIRITGLPPWHKVITAVLMRRCEALLDATEPAHRDCTLGRIEAVQKMLPSNKEKIHLTRFQARTLDLSLKDLTLGESPSTHALASISASLRRFLGVPKRIVR